MASKWIAALVGTCVPVVVLAAEPIVAKTGPAIFAVGGGMQNMFPEAQYAQVIPSIGAKMNVAPIKKKPEHLGEHAQFGFGFGYEGRTMRSFVLDGDEASGYVLYLDRNANGDLTDDAPIRFVTLDDGKPGALFAETVTETRDGKERTRTVQLRAFVTEWSKGRMALGLQTQTMRSGVLTIDGRTISFALQGGAALYDGEYDAVFFDANGDGTLDVAFDSQERYEVPERFVNLAGRSFEFKVDHDGTSITLIPLAEKRPDRANLSPGQPAPDFSAADTAGVTQSLARYRGKLVLVEFWGIWCGPCVEEMPSLVELYTKYHERGFEIIGVHSGEMKSELAAFVAKHKVTWAQIVEPEKDGAVHARYRVRSWPTYYLIGPDGVIMTNRARPSDSLPALLAKYLPVKSKSTPPGTPSGPATH